MPKKLDSCVKKLIEEGHTKDEAWAICKSKIKAQAQSEYEQKKRILTGEFTEEKIQEEE